MDVYMYTGMYSSAGYEVDISFLHLKFSHLYEELCLVNLPL